MSTTLDRSKTRSDVEAGQWLHMYRRMVMIRLFEELVNDLYTRALMPGLAHLYIGQEAVAVGICEALNPDDYITSTHRGHGHCLAKGASLDRMFAELLGKEAGYCKGKGGSMHIADPDTGNLGANAIVGGSAGIATGAALSAKRLKTGQVAVCFFGDGERTLVKPFRLRVVAHVLINQSEFAQSRSGIGMVLAQRVFSNF